MPKGVTHFNYVGPQCFDNDTGMMNKVGGPVMCWKATSAITVNQVVALDASNADQVVTAPAGASTRVIGVCVGRVNGNTAELGIGPAAGETAIVQIAGPVTVIADATIAIGDALIADAGTAGRVDVVTISATTNELSVIGVALTAGTAGNTMRMMLRL